MSISFVINTLNVDYRYLGQYIIKIRIGTTGYYRLVVSLLFSTFKFKTYYTINI